MMRINLKARSDRYPSHFLPQSLLSHPLTSFYSLRTSYLISTKTPAHQMGQLL